MRLYEYEAKDLLKKYGIAVPQSTLITSADSILFSSQIVAKIQVLANGRGKAGGIKVCNGSSEAASFIKEKLNSFFLKEKVTSILMEKKESLNREFYISIAYDTETESPVLLLGKEGGVEVEQNQSVVRKAIDPIIGLREWQARDAAVDAGFDSKIIPKVSEFAVKLYNFFVAEDCRLVEINPLAETDFGLVAVGALIELDDNAAYKHKDRSFPPRVVGIGRELTQRELDVKKANEVDYRGTVSYLELDGDVGFLAAGGGGSMAAMDALMQHGGRPANYAEHSGDPPREKVCALTKAILSKPNLVGLWIVGAIANFTRIDHTMQGMIDAFVEVKPKFPIVVRRSGPYEKEGLQMLKEAAVQHGLDVEVHGSETAMTATAKTIAEKSKLFKERHGNSN